MVDVRRHLKEAGIINAILIVFVMACGLTIVLSDRFNILTKFAIPIDMIALFIGLIYATKGYQKAAANYYKLYMLCGALSYLVSLTCAFEGNPDSIARYIGIVGLIVNVILMVVLAFAKDLGRQKSIAIAVTTFGINIIQMIMFAVREEMQGSSFPIVVNVLQLIVISAITCVFVLAKYAEKASRGH